ncbi:hypothetical protein STCU_01807 [Strigomonas culicis]|uniref:Uncharacterized protein n=1 Tax=Strigomonas culicis TaxID=28005 RepID=S9UZK3_9TRYP|nr:hypothetical protein STCU_03364 [Strigomonas culicis]EPY31760.1 hypothetical protein STCU_03265 [Strigomonas culicis]EPY34164.1 hypothetical protein STCU_01807 [Strigomonas culicis]|eukprot:EPY31620.1 hypothetical protein STCU_03364 [Strigomonas culicis]
MLRRTAFVFAVPKPNVERRRRRGQKKSTIRPGVPDLPKSAGGYVFQQLRPRLPIRWQYGWRWNMLKGTWLAVWLSFIGSVAYTMFFKYTDEDIARDAAQFTYVRNESGEVIDIGFKPIVDAGRRARRRADRLLDPDEED